MDIDKAAWIKIQRALYRLPLTRRRKVLKMLRRMRLAGGLLG